MSSTSDTTFGDPTVTSDLSSDQSSLLDNVLGAAGQAVTNTSSETVSDPERLSSSFSSPLYAGSPPPHGPGVAGGPSLPPAGSSQPAPMSQPPVAEHRSGVGGEVVAEPPMGRPAPLPPPGTTWPVQPTAPPLEWHDLLPEPPPGARPGQPTAPPLEWPGQLQGHAHRTPPPPTTSSAPATAADPLFQAMQQLLLQQQEQQRQQQEQQRQSQQMLAQMMTALLQREGPILNELPEAPEAPEGAYRPPGSEQGRLPGPYQLDPQASPPAMSVFSETPSAASRYASPVHRHIHRLQEACDKLGGDLNRKGVNSIKSELRDLERHSKDLEYKAADAEDRGDLQEDVQQEVEDLLRRASQIESEVNIKLDQMQEDEKRFKVESAQRPKIKFETFTGKATKWDAFMRDAHKIFSLYDEPNQKLIQLAAITSPEIAQVILRYSGSGEEGPTKALADLETKFGMPHLNLPILLTSLKETRTARLPDDVPAVAESILTQLEAIASLQGDEDYVSTASKDDRSIGPIGGA